MASLHAMTDFSVLLCAASALSFVIGSLPVVILYSFFVELYVSSMAGVKE
jgi:hypothetical protein